jgi:hypothetical protein
MEKKEKKDLEFNNDLAFNLSVKMLTDYANDCEVDEDKGVMDPMLGSYLLVNNLAIGLIYNAEGFEKDLIDILKDAIDDAEYKINKSRKAS